MPNLSNNNMPADTPLVDSNKESTCSQSLDSIKEIVSEIKFKDWKFRVGESNGVPFLQVIFLDTDLITHVITEQRCRKWMLSYHMVNNEIVRTAYKAVLAAMEHEVQETFSYKGVNLFHPHFNLDALVEFAKKRKIQVRK